MTRDLPDWQPFPLDGAETSPLELSGMRGSTLVLLGLPRADASGWAVRAAARIARQRAGRNRRLLLADLDLIDPRLHVELGAENGEGASDLLLFGASLGRVARPVDPGFLFVPAGTAVADPSPVLTSPRLDDLVQGFEDAGAELFLFLPWSIADRDRVLARARNLVLLAEPGEIGTDDLPDLAGLRIGAVLGPADAPSEGAGVDAPSDRGAGEAGPAVEPGPAAEGPEPAGEAEPAVDGAPVDVDAGGSEDEPEAAGGEVAAGPVGPAAPAAEGPTAERPPLARDRDPEEFDAVFQANASASAARPPRTTDDGEPPLDPSSVEWRVERARRRARRILLLVGVLLVLVVAVVVAGLVGLVEVPGVPRLAAFEGAGQVQAATPGGFEAHPDAAAPAEAADRAEEPTVEPVPPAPVRSTSVAVASYRDLAKATEQAAVYSSRSPDLLAYVAPVLVEDVEWFRLLVDAGDELPGAELADRVALALGGDASGWFPRPSGLAFHLGDADALDEAHRRVSELAAAGVPAYVLELPGPADGSPRPRFRVYGGGYADSSEAARMETVLRERGVPDPPLVPRVGRIPSHSSPPPSE